MFYMLQVKELAFIMQCCLLYRITDMTHFFHSKHVGLQ